MTRAASRVHRPVDLAETSTRVRGKGQTLTQSDRDQICRLVWAGTPSAEVALMFNVTASTVYRIVRLKG